MKAGQALGLLAGLGALNALSGGRNGTGQRFTGLLDMLDGGGAGQSGDRFEGGGLLSMLGNLFAKPLEAQDNVERIAADTNATKAVAEVLKKAVTPEQRASAAMTEENRQRGLLEDQFDPRDQQGATSFRDPMMGYPDMSTPAIEGYTVPRAADVPAVVSDYPDVSMPAIEGYTTSAQASREPVGLLNGNQIVPTMRQLDVPEIALLAQGPKFSPLFAADYRDYLEYLNTGRYPRD